MLNRRNVLWNIVILGLDQRIHKDKSIMLVSLWIAGSKSGNDKDEKNGKLIPLFFLLPWRGSGVGQFNLKHLIEKGEQVGIFVHTQALRIPSQLFYSSFQKVYVIRQFGAC